ncbi:hypothetical protein [Actinokineospora cianjurensis]|uniref:Uncharacterized protein n=1 Tax=Actinokineospora cianjurensis TaxID=585224 RepID=A0A421B1K7_9PSEU|nr:hypothetical protein [Actinokineospora cianjurensis]RLK58274.1 hypothetical protein CLV68_4370 [Actinokineospora cianjurensis]
MAELTVPVDPRDTPPPPPPSALRRRLRTPAALAACLVAAFAGWTLYEQLTGEADAFVARIVVCAVLLLAAAFLALPYALLATSLSVGLALVLAGLPDTDWLRLGIGAYLLSCTFLGVSLVVSRARERATYDPLVEELIAHGTRHTGEITHVQATGADHESPEATVTVAHPGGPTTLTRSFNPIHIPRPGDPVLVLSTPTHTTHLFPGDQHPRTEIRSQLIAAAKRRK